MTNPADYIREKGQKYDFAQLVQRLNTSMEAVAGHLNGLRQDQADFKPSASEWSLGEIIHHVTNSVRGMAQISDKLNRGEAFKRLMDRSAMGVTQFGVPVDTLRQNWEAMRRDLSAKLAAFTPPLSTAATYAHVEFGPLNAMEWLALNYLHNQRHNSQIERVKSCVGYPK